MPKRLGGNRGYKGKNSSWDLIGFPDGSSIGSTKQCNIVSRRNQPLYCTFIVASYRLLYSFSVFIPFFSIRVKKKRNGFFFQHNIQYPSSIYTYCNIIALYSNISIPTYAFDTFCPILHISTVPIVCVRKEKHTKIGPW